MTMFRKAFDNLKAVAPNHNPFAGHLQSDPDTKSRFAFVNAGLGTLADLISMSELVKVEEGAGAILLVFDYRASWEVGEIVTNTPIPSNSYAMENIHGMLQPRGDGKITRTTTNRYTICLTWEDIPGVGKDLALASIYPGSPDEPWDMTGLTEGQVVTGQELIDRGCTRVC